MLSAAQRQAEALLQVRQAHHEEAGQNLISQQAREGLERLSHGAVANDDDAAARQALLKVGGIPCVQLTRMRLENLAELLQGRRSKTQKWSFQAYRTLYCRAHGAIAHDIDAAMRISNSSPLHV